jgi:RNA polymerase sigma factor (sigma-70 family)
MDNYLHPALRQLKDQQIRFAPLDKRLEQINRAELLLSEIDPAKKYPYQFICFRILDFRPDSYPGLLLDGRELVHDLRRFIEDVSASTRIDSIAAGEPVWTVDDLSRNLRVSTKTINRWRDRGLVSRRFVIGGRTRVGFLKSSVDRFVSQNESHVERGARFCHLDDAEREQIVRRARRMVQRCRARPTEVIRRIARRLGRSRETIRYTLRNYDRENPSRAVFGRTVGPLGDQEKVAIYRSSRRGESVEVLARRFGKTRTTIYRVINEMRARHLLEQKLEFIHNSEFDQTDARESILGQTGQTPADAIAAVAHDSSTSSTKTLNSLPPYLASLYEIPLLTKEQEVYLFRKMNFLKYCAHRLRSRIDPKRVQSSMLDQIERLQKEALAVKNQIIRANLRLVVSIAKRHLGSSNSFDELVSDGNMSLIRAVEKFDYARGNKFSTYASWAIMKNYARSIPDEHVQRDRFVTGHDEMFEATADERSTEHEHENQLRQMRDSIARILEKLDERERSIIVSRFGLDEAGEPHTLEEVGNELGVTKERVRQLEVRAMDKLRQFADEAHIELPEE